MEFLSLLMKMKIQLLYLHVMFVAWKINKWNENDITYCFVTFTIIECIRFDRAGITNLTKNNVYEYRSGTIFLWHIPAYCCLYKYFVTLTKINYVKQATIWKAVAALTIPNWKKK